MFEFQATNMSPLDLFSGGPLPQMTSPQSGKYVSAISWPYLILGGNSTSSQTCPAINRSPLDSCLIGNFEKYRKLSSLADKPKWEQPYVSLLISRISTVGGWEGGQVGTFEDRQQQQWRVIVRAPYRVPRKLKQIFETHTTRTLNPPLLSGTFFILKLSARLLMMI